MHSTDSFLIYDLLDGYRSGRFTPAEVIERALQRADQAPTACLDHPSVARTSVGLRARGRAALDRGTASLRHSLCHQGQYRSRRRADHAGCAEYSYVPAKILQPSCKDSSMPGRFHSAKPISTNLQRDWSVRARRTARAEIASMRITFPAARVRAPPWRWPPASRALRSEPTRRGPGAFRPHSTTSWD